MDSAGTQPRDNGTAGAREVSESTLDVLSSSAQAVLEQASLWISVLDAENRVLLWNREAAMASGYPAEDLIGNARLWELLYPDSEIREAVLAHRGRSADHGELTVDFEAPVRCSDGTTKTIAWYRTILSSVGGLAPYTLAFGFDVTDRTAAQEDARRLAALTHQVAYLVGAESDLSRLLPAIVDSVHSAFSGYGVALLLVDESREWLVLESSAGREDAVPSRGYRHEIHRGITGRAVKTGETQMSGNVESEPDFIREAATATQSELVVPLRQNGEIIGVLDLQSPLPDAFDLQETAALETITPHIAASIARARLLAQASNRVQRLAVVNRIAKAVGSRLDAEDLMRTVYEELNTVFENEALYITTYDADRQEIYIAYGVEHGEILDPTTVPLGDGLTSYLIQHRKPLHIRDFKAELERGEVPLPRMIGDDVLYASWLGAPMVIEDRVLGTIAAMIDRKNAYTDEQQELLFTIADQVAVALENARLYAEVQAELKERQRAEEQVRRGAKELADANEEIKQFAYIVSHDLRAPLVNLKGFASELRMAIESIRDAASTGIETLPEDARQDARYALEEDIPEALGFIETSVTRMDAFINAVLRLSRLGRRQLKFEEVDPAEIVGEMRESLAHQIQAASAELVSGALPLVVADRTAMEQILGNLITNAVVYLDPGRAGRIEIGGEQRGIETLFWVRDNGRGIAKSDAEKVFAPFRRAGKQDVPGEGMGLSYVRTIVRQHGGRIWFESEPEVGTTFFFTISDGLRGGDDDEQ